MNHINHIRSIAYESLNLKNKIIEFFIPSQNDKFGDNVHPIQNYPGKVIFTSIGQIITICYNIEATLNLTGSFASFSPESETIHDGLGIIENKDIKICISKNGHAPEIKDIFNTIQRFSHKIIGISVKEKNYLDPRPDYFIWPAYNREADMRDLILKTQLLKDAKP